MNGLERLYRRSRLFNRAPFRRTAKSAVKLLIRSAELATRFRTSPWDALPYRIRFLLRSDERETREIIRRICRPGDVAVDVGAHVGYITTLLAALAGRDGRVVSFEPHPKVFRILEANVRRYPHVDAENIALGSRPGMAVLTTPDFGSMESSLRPPRRTRETADRVEELPVTVRTGDEVLREKGVLRFDFVKIDVEGAECDVLEGLQTTLRSSPRVAAVVELNPSSLEQFGRSTLDLFHALWLLGFETYECGKSTARLRIDGDRAALDLERLLADGYTNIVGFKGYAAAETHRALHGT